MPGEQNQWDAFDSVRVGSSSRREAQPGGSQSRSRLRWVPTLLIAGMFILYLLATRSGSGLSGWSDDYESALAESTATGRPLVLALHSRGCPPCAIMDRTVLSQSVVQQALGRFVPVRLDVGKHPALAARLGVMGTPTYTLVDAMGNIVAQVSGYLSVEAFLRFLKQASSPTRTPEVSAGTRPPTHP